MKQGIYLRTKQNKIICRNNLWGKDYSGKIQKVVCQICGKSFVSYTARLKKGFGKYCSMKCFGISRKKLYKDNSKHPRWKNFEIKRKCKICGKEIITNQYKISKRQNKFCSRKCYELSKRKEKVLVECENCHKKFYVFPCQAEKNFCSKICFIKYKKEKVKCLVCNKLFIKFKREKKRRFCSNRCSSIYTNNISQVSNKETSIELKLEQWLKDNNIQFEKQKRIKNISIVDFFIKPNICLYADGNYWHNLPNAIKRDRKQEKELKKQNYEVIRLWEKDINKGIRPTQLLRKNLYAKI